MDSFSFYQSLYERELKRRHDIDSSISVHVSLLTVLVTGNYFLNKNLDINFCLQSFDFQSWLVVATFILIGFSFYYLSRAYNNLLKGFIYQNLSFSTELREFEISFETDEECKEYNKDASPLNKMNFENELIKKLNSITDDNKTTNNTRADNLSKARSYIISAFIATTIQIISSTLFY